MLVYQRVRLAKHFTAGDDAPARRTFLSPFFGHLSAAMALIPKSSSIQYGRCPTKVTPSSPHGGSGRFAQFLWFNAKIPPGSLVSNM